MPWVAFPYQPPPPPTPPWPTCWSLYQAGHCATSGRARLARLSLEFLSPLPSPPPPPPHHFLTPTGFGQISSSPAFNENRKLIHGRSAAIPHGDLEGSAFPVLLLAGHSFPRRSPPRCGSLAGSGKVKETRPANRGLSSLSHVYFLFLFFYFLGGRGSERTCCVWLASSCQIVTDGMFAGKGILISDTR